MNKEMLSPKVKALYDAVIELITEDVDIKEMKVSDITAKAGIGKGTAYEYFSNKDEIICSALLYHINRVCMYVRKGLETLTDFPQMLYFILKCMEDELARSGCFVKFVHVLTDNGAVSRTLQNVIHEASGEICMPETLVDYVLQRGLETGSIKSEFPISYMKMSLMTKLIAYAFYLSDGCYMKEFTREQMRGLVCDSLIKEFN